MPIGWNPLANQAAQYAANITRKNGGAVEEGKEAEETKGNTPTVREAASEEAKKTLKQPPQKDTSIIETYAKAITRTADAAIKVAGDLLQLELREGLEASRKEEANLTPKQKQVFETAATSTPSAVNQGIRVAAAAELSGKIKTKYSQNEHFDDDAISVAARVMEAFMGGMV